MRRLAVISLLLFAFVVAGALAFVEHSAASAASAVEAPTVEFEVPKGSSAKSIGFALADKGLIKNRLAWRWHVWRRGGLNAKAGRHLVSASMPLRNIATTLEGVPLPDDEPFTVVEGWRLRDTDSALAAAGLIQPGAYLAAARRPADFHAPFPLPSASVEGYLYPETYRVERTSFDAKKFVQRQLDAFTERFYAPNKDEIEKSGRSLHALVTMASMLEREEPVPAQRALVAGILWKRLDNGWALGVDATSRYPLDEWNDRKAFLKALRDPEDPYNTRLRKGLPPGPIGAPAIDSLLAALRPASSAYWYYLHDSSRTLHPSKDAAEHERLRARYGVH